MKKKLLLVLLALLICIPSIIAFVSYRNAIEAEKKDTKIIYLSFTDFDGKNTIYNEDDVDIEQCANLFTNMINNATLVKDSPRVVDGLPYYMVKMSTKSRDFKYNFYFSQDVSSNYYKNSVGDIYLIDINDAQTFLNTKYASSIYTSVTFPSLVLSSEYVIKPFDATWYNRSYNDSYIKAGIAGYLDDAVNTYKLNHGLTLSFNLEPSTVLIKITDVDTNEVYFNNYYTNLSALSLNKNVNVSVEITATWNKSSDYMYYGEISYKFLTSFSSAVSNTNFKLTIPGSSVVQGDFIGITAYNVSDLNAISFTSYPDIDYIPTFFRSGDNAYAFIPLSLDLEAGEYTFTLEYEDCKQDLKLTLTNKDFGSSYPNYLAEIYDTYYTDECKQAADDELRQYLMSSSPKALWSGNFDEGMTEDGTDVILIRGFGRYMEVSKNDVKTGDVYRHEGVDYLAKAYTPVGACNDGEVIYAGYVDYWGYTVIIEHGYGLKTWYCNMANVSVKAGDTVSKGDEVGKAGCTGFATDSGVHIGMSVFDKFVCPYDVQTYGFTFK